MPWQSKCFVNYTAEFREIFDATTYVFTNAWALFCLTILCKFQSARLTSDPGAAHKSHGIGCSY